MALKWRLRVGLADKHRLKDMSAVEHPEQLQQFSAVDFAVLGIREHDRRVMALRLVVPRWPRPK